MCVCNLVFGIPLHAARRAMAAAPPLPKQSVVAVLHITFFPGTRPALPVIVGPPTCTGLCYQFIYPAACARMATSTSVITILSKLLLVVAAEDEAGRGRTGHEAGGDFGPRLGEARDGTRQDAGRGEGQCEARDKTRQETARRSLIPNGEDSSELASTYIL